jgi:hypothetical protein
VETIRPELPQPPEFEGMSQYRPPKCFELVGEKFELVMDDGYDYTAEFVDRDHIIFGRKGEEKQYDYDCAKPEDLTYFVNIELTGAVPRTGVTLVLDTEQSLVTSCICTVGQNPRYPKMTKGRILFGAIRRPDGTVPTIRHGYTRDLLGKSINWHYGKQETAHVYYSERYYRLTHTPESMEERRRRDPEFIRAREEEDARRTYEDHCDYIKIKDGVYAFHVDEELVCLERGSGNNLFFLMNLNRLHDVGRSFGHNGEGQPENYIYGAVGEYYDASDVFKRETTEYIK